MKTVIEMAREAGDDEWKILIKHVMKHFPSEFHCFAELVRADAIAAEREACMNALNALPYQRSTKYDCMDAIRARGQA